MQILGATKFERLFRVVAALDVDKEDLKRLVDFLNERILDLLIRGQAMAKSNGRDVIQTIDIPITKGLQERIQEFKTIDRELDLRSVLSELITRPPLDLAYSDETEAEFPLIAGAFCVALAKTFKIIEPNLKNPQSRHWERSYQIFGLLL
jgi:hypothetical protein